ncbi:two-component system response regulator [candidate division KSB1 bacterium 4484_87]|nr:MAG: two-component system response regulator [candidate division KSB1 bacterium 4484_87]
MEKLSILIIDDEEAQLLSLKSYLQRRKYKIFTATSGKEGLTLAEKNAIDLVLTDFRMPEWDGLTVLKRIKALNPEIDVVVMTAYGNVENAVEMMKSGAYDYLTKPINLDDLEILIERVAEKRDLQAENRALKEQLVSRYSFGGIISRSNEMENVLNTAARVAPSKATVLIRGESGTGKEVIARAIHFASPRRDKPFVVVNVAALSENLLESELFGHEKGAFTGATQQRIGRFEQAHSGTLFIDEVGDIPLSVQVKLLRAIQFGQIERLGSNKTVETDVRIIAATHRPLEKMLEDGSFRDDLFYRLNVVSIWIPPLRKRKADIPPLVDFFIKKYAKQNDKPVQGITREALDFLMKYEFPGNVRELENMIESGVVMCRGELIMQKDLPAPMKTKSERAILDPYHLQDGYQNKLQTFEKEMIREALSQSGGNQSAAARLLGITERHLRSRLEKLGMK